jgi:hypothetical protein
MRRTIPPLSLKKGGESWQRVGDGPLFEIGSKVHAGAQASRAHLGRIFEHSRNPSFGRILFYARPSASRLGLLSSWASTGGRSFISQSVDKK